MPNGANEFTLEDIENFLNSEGAFSKPLKLLGTDV